MTTITALGSRYGIQGALGRSVKRASSSAWSPADITGCVLWLDFGDADTMFTDAGSTKVSTDGDSIYQINDKSGNSNHSVQTDSSMRPLYKTSIQNSKSAGLFDGSNDRMRTSNNVELQYFTIFAVFNRTGGNSNGGPIGMDKNTFAGNAYRLFQFRINTSTNNAELIGFNTAGGAFTDSQAITQANISLATGVRSSSSVQIYVNGASDGATSATGTDNTVTDYFSIGKSYQYTGTIQHLGGYICEIVVYNSALSSENLTTVTNYLNTKWAIYS